MTCARTLRLQNGEPGRGVCSSLSPCFCLLFVLTLGLANQIAQFPSHICESNPLLGNTSCKVKDLTCKVCNADRTKKSSFDLTCNVTDSLRNFVKFRITNLSTSLAAKKEEKWILLKWVEQFARPGTWSSMAFQSAAPSFGPTFRSFSIHWKAFKPPIFGPVRRSLALDKVEPKLLWHHCNHASPDLQSRANNHNTGCTLFSVTRQSD